MSERSKLDRQKHETLQLIETEINIIDYVRVNTNRAILRGDRMGGGPFGNWAERATLRYIQLPNGPHFVPFSSAYNSFSDKRSEPRKGCCQKVKCTNTMHSFVTTAIYRCGDVHGITFLNWSAVCPRTVGGPLRARRLTTSYIRWNTSWSSISLHHEASMLQSESCSEGRSLRRLHSRQSRWSVPMNEACFPSIFINLKYCDLALHGCWVRTCRSIAKMCGV
jgi:hypothetical protein